MELIKRIVRIINHYLLEEKECNIRYITCLIFDHSEYLDRFLNEQPFPPFEIEIQMSSYCNLHCRWCIGETVKEGKHLFRLPNNITNQNIDKIIHKIIQFGIDGLGVKTVRISGFIGEPLVHKICTLKAINRLKIAGIKVGLFTNGVLMDKDTWETISNIEYVHISLDSGPKSYFKLKEQSRNSIPDPYNAINSDKQTYDKVINNIKELNNARKCILGNKVKINIGYVMVPGNHTEIYEATKNVKEAGADSIRFKCDIGGKYDLYKHGIVDNVFKNIDRARKDFEDEDFKVHIIHNKKQIISKYYNSWKCKYGCYYHSFIGTIGSDGKMYLCDHNTLTCGAWIGDPINESLFNIWNHTRRHDIANRIEANCYSIVCPPFGNRLNRFLYLIDCLKKRYGLKSINKALKIIRENRYPKLEH